MNRCNVLLIFSTLFLIQCVQKRDEIRDVNNISQVQVRLAKLSGTPSLTKF